MKWVRLRHLTWVTPISLVGAVAVAVALVWIGTGRSKPEDRVYRIGWDPDPPFQAVGRDGQATGLAVELVRAAARRRGIRLEWVRQPNGVDTALRNKNVDLWPLVTINPQPQEYLHFT